METHTADRPLKGIGFRYMTDPSPQCNICGKPTVYVGWPVKWLKNPSNPSEGTLRGSAPVFSACSWEHAGALLAVACEGVSPDGGEYHVKKHNGETPVTVDTKRAKEIESALTEMLT